MPPTRLLHGSLLASWSWRVLPAAVGALWVALILVTPSWRAPAAHVPASGRAVVAGLVDLAASRVCHRRRERSLHLHGQPLPVCGRCTGLYVAGAMGLIAAALVATPRASAMSRVAPRAWVRRPSVWILAAGAPTLLTWTLEVAGGWEPGTPLRAAAALPLGATAGWIAGRALAQPRSRQ